jgi:ABC-type transport system involved in cytochrome c biogenesis permease component
MAAFSYVYVAAGTVLSAMTTSLRSGELLLRILLFPLMIPSIMFAMMSVQGTFIERPEGAAGLGPNQCSLALVSMGTIYLLAGYLLFPKVVEE